MGGGGRFLRVSFSMSYGRFLPMRFRVKWGRFSFEIQGEVEEVFH